MCIDDGESQQWKTGPAPVVQQATPRCVCVFTGCHRILVPLQSGQGYREQMRDKTRETEAFNSV